MNPQNTNEAPWGLQINEENNDFGYTPVKKQKRSTPYSTKAKIRKTVAENPTSRNIKDFLQQANPMYEKAEPETFLQANPIYETQQNPDAINY